MGGILIYFLAINVLTAGMLWLDARLMKNGKRGVKPKALLNWAVVLGGSAGTLIWYLVKDIRAGRRHGATHEQRQWDNKKYQHRLRALMWLAIHLTLLFIAIGPNRVNAVERITAFYDDHAVLCWYAAVINAGTFMAFAADKVLAMMGERIRKRVPELALLILCAVGGAAGGWLAMDLLNHKTNDHPQFTSGVPMLLVAHLVVLLGFVSGLL